MSYNLTGHETGTNETSVVVYCIVNGVKCGIINVLLSSRNKKSGVVCVGDMASEHCRTSIPKLELYS